MSKFSKTLIELRKEKGLTQSELAFLIELNQRAVSNWECGSRVPELKTVIRIADKLDVPYDVLIVPLIEDIKSRAV